MVQDDSSESENESSDDEALYSKSKKEKKVFLLKQSDSEGEYKFVNSINKNIANKSDDKWCAQVTINNKKLKLKLDTGADCSVISLKLAKQLNAEVRKSAVKRLIAYNNETIKVVGESKLKVIAKDTEKTVTFQIVDGNFQPILGRNMCEKMGFVARINKVEVNEPIGCCNTFEYDIDFVDNPTFKIIPPRKVPHSQREQIKKELEKMVRLNVIKPISEPTPAVSPMKVVEKNNKIRICMDPTELNKNIIRRHYPLNTVEEIAARVSGSKLFTKLDCNKGFWQIKVSERTSKYLTFSTPWGRFCYLRLPFGISSAPEVFSEVINRTLEGIEKCECAMDDIFIHGVNKQELEATTKRVVDRLKAAGFTLNQEKCEFNKKSIKFLGHIFDENGCKTDEEKIKAIHALKTPTTVKELQRLLGLVTYLGKFIQNLSELTAPLRELLNKDTAWSWQEPQQKAFETIKKVITSTPVLKFYDVKKPVKLSVDASSKAIGACLMQDDQPVAYATKTFTKSEQNHPQIVKEALAIRFACSKFHEFIHGRKLVVETDHKPLETIFKKPLHCAPLRLQQIIWDVLPYTPEVRYKKGTKIPIADTLSRDCEQTTNENEEKEMHVNLILAINDALQQRIVESTASDVELKLLKAVIMRGWPDSDTKLPEAVRKYAPFKSQITFEQGMLFNANKIILPQCEIKNIIQQCHTGHVGVTKSISRARQSMYWHGQSKDIKTYVENCQVCQQTQKANTREPMIIKKVPEYPFQRVSSDIFYVRGKEYLLIADHYSGFIDIKQLKQSDSPEVIQILKQWFAVHGIPEIFESDNGPQYSSQKFVEFAREWCFKHNTSSPTYSRSNGFAERMVQTAKNLLKRCYIDNTDPYMALLMLRNTERNDTLKSPTLCLFSRATRTPLTIDAQQLNPKIVEGVSKELYKQRAEQKRYADKSATSKQPILPGDKVMLQTGHRKWEPASVVETTQYPRSVIVETENTKKFRRNTIHLRKVKLTKKLEDTPTPLQPTQSTEQLKTNERN